MTIFLIQVQGQVDVKELNALSPHQMDAVQAAPTGTRFAICTDQSGLIGMLRFLDNYGLEVTTIEVRRE